MNLVTVNFRRNIYNLTKILSFAPTFTCLMKSKILKASKSCDIFALKIFKMGGIMLQTMWNICERVCESWSQQFWLLGLQLCLRVESRRYRQSIYHVPRGGFDAFSTRTELSTRFKAEWNMCFWLSDSCYSTMRQANNPLYNFVDRDWRENESRSMSYNSCTFFAFLREGIKIQKNIIFDWW